MGFIELKCPNCSAEIELDDKREFGFCSYCGTKIVQDVQKIEVTGNINIDNEVKVQGVSTVENLLIRAQQFLDEKDLIKAKEYIDKVLDLDPYNIKAKNLLDEYNEILHNRGCIAWLIAALIIILPSILVWGMIITQL